MKFHLTIKSIFLILVVLNQVDAQTTTANRDYLNNKMFWFQGVIVGKISPKWTYHLDLEYRRQADPEYGYKKGDNVGTDQSAIFKNPYQYAIRPFIHYQPNEHIRFSLSPLTWFGSYTFPVNGRTYYTPEFRWSPQVTFYKNFGRVQIHQRYRLEFRYFGKKTEDTNLPDPTGPSSSYEFTDQGRHTRLRILVRAVIPLNSMKVEKGTHYIMTSEELMFKFGKYVDNANFFDQSRFYLVYGYKFHPEMRFEIGYLNQIAFRLNNGYGQLPGNNIDLNNNLFVSYIIDDFTSFFKKEKIEELPATK
ncbi:MAG: DUF2490 domain-containing protein [Opitutaceae bacterium]|nr:DUF2490 domain-containing protein [Cytophagales bacterium]